MSAAIEKYVGGVDIANTELGIAPKRQTKWSKIILQNEVDQCVNVYGLSPTKLLYDHRKNKVELSDEKVVQLKQMIDAISRYPGKIEAIYLELGIEAPKRARN